MTTRSAAQWARLPLEMRVRPQWLLAAPNEKGQLKVPTTIDVRGRVVLGSTTDPATWLEFDYAVECALEQGFGLGYVLAATDPFTCIDLDVKDAENAPDKPALWTTPEQMQRFASIVQHFDTFTEVSQSGKGAHLWLYGNIGEGVHRDGVEIYSQERFMVCTGNVYRNIPIANRDDMLVPMVQQLRALEARAAQLVEHDAVHEDAVLWERARNAENGAKFSELCSGDWVGQGFPSQSEADLALMSMFTFYSKSDEQCRRMFRQTGLGQRDKAQKDDKYLDRTLKLIRGRQAREEQAAASMDQSVAALIAQLQDQSAARASNAQPPAAPPQPPQAPPAGQPPALPPTPPPSAPQPAPALPPAPAGGLDWPPGLAGAIAQFVYSTASRPVKEVAIVSAIGFLAGVCGKGWVIPGSGLNLYIILVARSAIGKEAMHGGLSTLLSRLREAVPTCDRFVTFNDFASAPALAKACAENSSFVNVAGEWGKKFKRLSVEGDRDGQMSGLRTLMTNLYQKSGPNSTVGGISYSNKDNNVASVSGVAYSMIGETTPRTLYDCLSESMMEDGFLSRFTLVEYDGIRPPLNHNPNTQLDTGLASHLQNLCFQATTLLQNNQRTPVNRTHEAGQVLNDFDLECDAQINSTHDEAWRQMWNRAHLKVLRFSALLAVGDNFIDPMIQLHHVQWALDVVRRDMKLMQDRMNSGDIGLTDTSRERKLLAILKEYLTTPQAASYGVPEAMRKDGYVPRKYLQMRTCRVSSFTAHHLGATRALDDALRSLCDSGYLVEIDKAKIGEQFTFQGRAFRIVQLG